MSGMIDESLDQEGLKGEPYEFMSKPIWKRMLIIAAGPIFNILLTVFIISGTVYHHGIGESVGPVIGAVSEDSPAARAGLLPDDRILTIDGVKIESWDEMAATIHDAKGRTLLLEWERKGQMMQAELSPEYDLVYDVSLIGGGAKTVPVPVNGVAEALQIGVVSTWNYSAMILRSFKLMIAQKIGRENVAGPVRIVQIIGDSARMGVTALLSITAMISLSLGLINLFPIPALDGGHLLLLFVEAIKRKPISLKARLVWQQIGLALLLALMIFVVFNDVANLL